MIGRALHMVSESMGLSGNAFLGTTLVNVYGKCGSIVDAEYAFQALSERTVVSWNSMLCAYIEHCQVEKALLLYRQMKESSCVDGDQHTLTFVIQACSALMEKAKSRHNECAYGVRAISELGQALHAEARKMAFFL
jgi:pentatricopeptide repeat protein